MVTCGKTPGVPRCIIHVPRPLFACSKPGSLGRPLSLRTVTGDCRDNLVGIQVDGFALVARAAAVLEVGSFINGLAAGSSLGSLRLVQRQISVENCHLSQPGIWWAEWPFTSWCVSLRLAGTFHLFGVQ